MSRSTIAVLVLGIVFFGFLPSSATAQQHFSSCISRTDASATIIIPSTAHLTVSGIDVEEGDEIAVFGADGTCAGVGVYDATGIGISVWGEDAYTQIGGMVDGEALRFRIWDASAGTEVSGLEASYGSDKPFLNNEGVYTAGAIYEVRGMSVATDIDQASDTPEVFVLDQNYPNPFNQSTTIGYSLETAADVTLEVFDLLGRRVEKIVSGQQAPGRHEVRFDGAALTNGMYIYRLTAGERTETRRMVLAR